MKKKKIIYFSLEVPQQLPKRKVLFGVYFWHLVSFLNLQWQKQLYLRTKSFITIYSYVEFYVSITLMQCPNISIGVIALRLFDPSPKFQLVNVLSFFKINYSAHQLSFDVKIIALVFWMGSQLQSSYCLLVHSNTNALSY